MPIEQVPVRHTIVFDVDGEYCISDTSRRLVLEDMENLKAALLRCNGTLEVYNKSLVK